MAVESLDDWDGELTATLLQLGRMHSETEGFTVQIEIPGVPATASVVTGCTQLGAERT